MSNSRQRARISVSRRLFLLASCATLGLSSISYKVNATPFPAIKAYRDPGCGCCEKWVARLQAAGFSITMEDDANLATRKTAHGIPDDLRGCHTAIVGAHVIEGHVPADDIVRFLAMNSDALGLAVPGMPLGSPGMEADGATNAYEVILFYKYGSRKVFYSYL